MTLYLSGTAGDQPTSWRLEESLATIGRSSACEIHLADPSVSRRHAEITLRDQRWFVRDLGSHNGTRLNGVEVLGEVEIGAGDTLQVGDVVLHASAEAPSHPVLIAEGTRMDTSVQLRADRLVEARAHDTTAGEPLVGLLAAAGQLLVLPRPLPETCDEILEVIARAVPGSRHVLALRDETTGDLRQMAWRCCGGRPDRPLALSRAIVDRVLEECTSVLTADAREDPRFRAQESVILQDVHSAMAVPLFDNRRVLGLVYVDHQERGAAFGSRQLEILTLLANMAAVKITNARLLEAEQARQRLAHELATAAKIQRGLLPHPLALAGWQLDGWLDTCHEVGGDLYDWVLGEDGRLLLLVGDVSGKGMGAALLMSSFLASARVLYASCADPAALATRLGAIVRSRGDPGQFVTAFVGCLDTRTGTLRYVNAGHPAGALLRGGGIVPLESNGVPLGLLPGFGYASASAEIRPGETLAVFSDGITEARSGDEFFGDARLHAALLEHGPGAGLDGVRRGVLGQVEAFVGDAPRGDDTTLLLVRRDPS